MRKLYLLSTGGRSDRDVNEEDCLEVFPLRVVFDLFAATRDFNELSLKGFKLCPVVFGVPPPVRRDRGEVAHN